MRSQGFDIQPLIEVRAASLHETIAKTGRSICVNNTVDNPIRRKGDMENVGAHGSGVNKDGNKEGYEAGASAEHAGTSHGNQSVYGCRPCRKGLVYNPYLPNKGQMPNSCHE